MDKRGIIVFTPDGALPEVQLIFASNGSDAFVKVEGKHYQIKAGLSCLIHSLVDKLGAEEVMQSVLIGLTVPEMESEGEEE